MFRVRDGLGVFSFFAVTVGVAGCDSHLLSTNERVYRMIIEDQRFAQLAAQLVLPERHVMVDLRGDMLLQRPADLNIKETDINLMKSANVLYATYDPTNGGVLFALDDLGIGISGSGTGVIYMVDPNHIAEVVPDLEKGIVTFKSEIRSKKRTSGFIVQKINPQWGVYYEAF